jgi:hypothetical protein
VRNDVVLDAAALHRVAAVDHSNEQFERRWRTTAGSCEVCLVRDTPALKPATSTSPPTSTPYDLG